MADDKKAKKKKAKKDKEEAPAPEPAPVAEPPPVAEDDWLSAATAETPAEAPQEQGQEEVPAGAEQEQEEFLGDPEGNAPPPAKKKPKFFIYWNRRKPKFYDYNFDYGEKYYSPLVSYIDGKNLGARDTLPRRTAFAQRGIDISLQHKSRPDMVTQNLMHDVRSSIRGYEDFQKYYAYEADRAYFV